MKKPIQILFLVSSLICYENTNGCEIKSIKPSGVSPGDTVLIEIISDFINCGDFKRAGFIDFTNNYDTVYFEEFEIINDSTATVLIYVPQNMTYNKSEFFICNEHYWDNRLDTWLTIGSPITVFYPELCMVTVNNNGKNMVIWQPPTLKSIDSVSIYKEVISNNNFLKIGTEHVNNQYFTDILSIPAQSSERYLIEMEDLSGNKTLLSSIHKTIHLTISAGLGGVWNLAWDDYEGFEYNSFKILRRTDNEDFVEISERPKSTKSYTDLNPPDGTVYYQIEVVNPNPCNISNLKSSKTIYSSTLSNIVSSNQGNSIFNKSIEGIDVYPNPVDNIIYIKNIEPNATYICEIISLEGKLINKEQKVTDNTEIDISKLSSGLYLIRLSNENKSKKLKFFKR